MRICILLLIFLLISAPVWGQGKKRDAGEFELRGILEVKEQKKLLRLLKDSKDSLAFKQTLDDWIYKKQTNGFLEYTGTQESSESGKTSVSIFEGPYYYYQSIQLHEINEQYPQRLGINRLVEKQAPVNWEDLELRMKNCLDLYQNEGYPFASFQQLKVAYASHAGDSVGVNLSYAFQPGPLVTIDSIQVQGKIREKSSFVQALSGVTSGDIFRQKALQDIPKILNNSIYYENVKEPEIKFRPDNKVDLILEMEAKETSKLDILFGILPPTDNSQRLRFTGSFDIALLSSFKRGELLEIKFDKLTENSAQTHLKLMLPYILRTPLRLSSTFDLVRQNEDFQNQSLDLSALYDFSPFLSASFFLNNRSTRLLGESITDTTLTNLPQLDANRRTIGIGLHFENLDYRLNPSKGISTSLKIGLGTRSIRENKAITVSRPEFYEGISLEQPSKEIDFSIKYFHQLIPRHILHVANHTYWLDIENVLRNDQLQVGGSRSIRGFNENEFFTDFYSYVTLEYRLQLERNSFIFLFGDYAYLENSESNSLLHPRSIGLGMNYGTKAGIISISYAMGTSEEQSFQPARGRVHIGIINQF